MLSVTIEDFPVAPSKRTPEGTPALARPFGRSSTGTSLMKCATSRSRAMMPANVVLSTHGILAWIASAGSIPFGWPEPSSVLLPVIIILTEFWSRSKCSLTSSSESMSALLVSSRASIRVRFDDNTDGDRRGGIGLILRRGGRGMRPALIRFEIVLPFVVDAPGLRFGGIFTEWMHADELVVYFSAIGN